MQWLGVAAKQQAGLGYRDWTSDGLHVGQQPRLRSRAGLLPRCAGRLRPGRQLRGSCHRLVGAPPAGGAARACFAGGSWASAWGVVAASTSALMSIGMPEPLSSRRRFREFASAWPAGAAACKRVSQVLP